MPGSLRGRIGKTICGVVPKSLVPPVPADCAVAVSERLATQGMTARSSTNARIFLPSTIGTVRPLRKRTVDLNQGSEISLGVCVCVIHFSNNHSAARS